MLAHQVSKAELMEMTPAEIWYLFERASEVRAVGRLELVVDLTSVAAPTQFVDGVKALNGHIEALKQVAGLAASYTKDTTQPDTNDGHRQ